MGTVGQLGKVLVEEEPFLPRFELQTLPMESLLSGSDAASCQQTLGGPLRRAKYRRTNILSINLHNRQAYYEFRQFGAPQRYLHRKPVTTEAKVEYPIEYRYDILPTHDGNEQR